MIPTSDPIICHANSYLHYQFRVLYAQLDHYVVSCTLVLCDIVNLVIMILIVIHITGMMLIVQIL